MSEEQIIDFLINNSDYFVTNDLVISIVRTLGWLLVKGVNKLVEGSKTIYDATFGMIDITRYAGIDNFISEYTPLLQAFLVLSLVALGYMFIFGKEKKHDLLTSVLIFAVVITSSSFLFSQLNTFTILFKDAIISDSGDRDGNELVRQNLYDLRYIDNQIGIANMSSSNVPQYNELTEQDMHMINISETIANDEEGLSDEAKDILSKRLVYDHDQSYLEDVYNGVAMTSFLNTFYFRYQFHFGTYFLNALALILLYFGLGYVNIKVIVELVRSRVLVTLFSSDLSSKKKAARILESIRDGYYALCFTAIELRLYLIITEYVNEKTELSSFVRAIILVFIAFTMIEGSSIAEKITGVDAGISATTHRLMGAVHTARGVTQFAMQMQQLRTLSSMKKNQGNQGNARYERGASEGNYTHYSGNGIDGMPGNGTDGMPGNENSDSRTEEKFDSQSDSSSKENTDMQTDSFNSENMDLKTSMETSEFNGDQMGETDNLGINMNSQNDVGVNDPREKAEKGSMTTAADKNFAQMDSKLSEKGEGVYGNRSGQERAFRTSPDMASYDGKKGMFDRWEEKRTPTPQHTGRSSEQNMKNPGNERANRQMTSQKVTSETVGKTTYVGGDGGGDKSMFAELKATDVRKNFDSKKGKEDK